MKPNILNYNFCLLILLSVQISGCNSSLSKKEIQNESAGSIKENVLNGSKTFSSEANGGDSSFISRKIFNVSTFDKDLQFKSFKVLDSAEGELYFTGVTQRDHFINGEIFNDEDLHTFHATIISKDSNNREFGENEKSYYMDEILYLTEIFFKDSIPYKLVKCSDDKKFESVQGRDEFMVLAYGGNLNEISARVIDSTSRIHKIEYVVRDIGDLTPFKICDR
ncbi:hypothetical protein [Sporocytophaga myxococcoides]|uniref:hypothetical protein n=1 Tax=Sporocytophaga myxococcoides TaxID=153721 RepID=UPI000423EA47|nr:hypothetical protein [Sporocytophaga myxococcoides]